MHNQDLWNSGLDQWPTLLLLQQQSGRCHNLKAKLNHIQVCLNIPFSARINPELLSSFALLKKYGFRDETKFDVVIERIRMERTRMNKPHQLFCILICDWGRI